jgi:hypothetical protein
VECIYKLHESKILKARGLQIITKTLTILKLWKCAWVTVQTEAQWVHSAQNAQEHKPFGCTVHRMMQRTESFWVHSALSARLWAEIPTHVLIRVGGGGGGILSEILLLQLKTWLLTGKARPVLVPARQMDQK